MHLPKTCAGSVEVMITGSRRQYNFSNSSAVDTRILLINLVFVVLSLFSNSQCKHWPMLALFVPCSLISRWIQVPSLLLLLLLLRSPEKRKLGFCTVAAVRLWSIFKCFDNESKLKQIALRELKNDPKLKQSAPPPTINNRSSDASLSRVELTSVAVCFTSIKLLLLCKEPGYTLLLLSSDASASKRAVCKVSGGACQWFVPRSNV